MDRRSFLSTLAVAPFLLRTDPDAFARRLGGTPLALVTADHQAEVLAVHLGEGGVYRRLGVPPGPRSIETVGWTSAAIVAHTASGALTLVDARTLRTRPIRGRMQEPRYTATRLGMPYAYVSDSGLGEVLVVDAGAARIVGRVAVGGPARHLAVSRDRQQLWAVLGSKAAEVAVLDISRPTRPRLVRTIEPPFLVHDVGFPGGERAWLSGGDRSELAIYHARTARLVRRLSADAPPQHLTFAAGRAYVTSGADGTLRVYSLRTGRLVRTARIPVGSYNIAEGWGTVFTPSLDQGTLCVLTQAARIRWQRRLASSSHDACFLVTA